MMTTQRVLITGGAGFIGSHLCDAMLADGCDVTALDNFAPFYPRSRKERHIKAAIDNGLTLIEGDITNPNDVKTAFNAAKPDVVVHLAACAGVRPSIENPTLYAHVNVVGTQTLLDQAVAHGVSKFIVAGSSSVYGNNDKVPFAETDDVSKPISPYAATKVATELVCRTAAHLHGLNVTALRFFTVFGPRQRPDLAIQKFMIRIAKGQPIPVFGDGSTSRDYTFVADIVQGIKNAIHSCGDHERFRVYNLGGDHPITLTDLISAIEKQVGKKAVIDRKPMQPGDVNRTWADLTRSRNELCYAPETSIEAGLSLQWDWVKKHDLSDEDHNETTATVGVIRKQYRSLRDSEPLK